MSRYSNYVIKNNVFAELVAPISSLATTIQLKSGQGARRGTDFPILATLEAVESGKVIKREIVKITGRSGDYLTVVRGFAPCPPNDDSNSQGTTTFSFSMDDTINIYIPKEIFDLINNGIKFLETQGTDRMRVLEAASGTPLAIDIMPGNFRCADDNIVYAGVTDQLLTDNATNYIMIDGTGTLQISTTDRDTRYTRLAKVTCASGEITEIQDRRLDTIGGNLGGLQIHTLTEKATPSAADELVIADSEDSYNNKRITVANMSVQNIVRFVTLGENVTAGNGLGAAYIGSDGKAYLTDLSDTDKMWADGIIIDSGNTGDTVRMATNGFINNNQTGNIYLTSGIGQVATDTVSFTTGNFTVDLGATYCLQRIFVGYAGDTTKYYGITIDNVFVGLYTAATNYISLNGLNGRSIKIQLYQKYSSRGYMSTTTASGNVTYQIYYYSSGNKGEYGLVDAYTHGNCIGYSDGNKLNINKRSILKTNTMSVLNPTSNGETTVFQAKHNGIMTINYYIGEQLARGSGLAVVYSYNNSQRHNMDIATMSQTSSNLYTFVSGQLTIPIVKGYYYKCYYRADASYYYASYIFVNNIIYDS